MMKSLKMGKVFGSMKRKNGSGNGNGNGNAKGNGSSSSDVIEEPQGDGPEATAARNIKAFCEAASQNAAGDEVLYLPPIVDAAESSPQAAAECARVIRKLLKRDNWSKPSYQYNAIMLMRILADNPGPTFTRNLDQKFASVTKELLKSGRDPSVRQILMETLDSFEKSKSYDEGLSFLIDMWRREKEKAQKLQGGRHHDSMPRTPITPTAPVDAQSQNYFARSHSNRTLPGPEELASRLEEAKTSASLLQQVVTNTPPGEVLNNDLIKEFADRCTSASRSIQLYMTADDPAPDHDLMESLIDTNEQLQASLSLHQRAMLNARKYAESEGSSNPDLSISHSNGAGSSRRTSPRPEAQGHGPPPPRNGKGKAKEEYGSAAAGPSRSHTPPGSTLEDPFRDEVGGASGSGAGSSSAAQDDRTKLAAAESFHPGFSATPSYLNRQESALDKETMHGGAAGASGGEVPQAVPGNPKVFVL